VEKRGKLSCMDRCYKLRPLAEGGYGVIVPSLPGCQTWGRTYEEVVTNAEEAIQSFITALQRHDRPIPVERRHYQEVQIQVRVPTEG
jgi:predicted RNase H-like HicB family nuclease